MAKSTNIRFMSHNILDKAGIVKVYSSEAANFPGSNIEDDLRTKVWRTTGIANEWIDFYSYVDLLTPASGTTTLLIAGPPSNIYNATYDFSTVFSAGDTILIVGSSLNYGVYTVSSISTSTMYVNESLVNETDVTGSITIYRLTDAPTVDAQAFCIANTNLSGNAKITVRGDNDGRNIFDSPPTPPDYEEEFLAYETIFGFGEGGFGEHGFGGTLLPEEMPIYTTIVRYFSDLPSSSDNKRYYRAWRIKFVDDTSSETYIEFGKIFLGPYFEPAVGFAWGWQLAFVDPSKTDYSLGGQAYTDILTPYNTVNIQFNSLTEWDVIYYIRRLIQEFGTHKDIFINLLTDTAKHRLLLSLYGRFNSNSNPVSNPSNGRYNATLNFRESV